MPAAIGLAMRALDHDAIHVDDTPYRGQSDGFLARNLSEVDCDWLLTLDQYRQAEVWADVYTALTEGTGRVVRIRPMKHGSARAVVPNLMRYIVGAYETWAPLLMQRRIRLIDLGRGASIASRTSGPRSRGAASYSAYTDREVAGLMQQQLGYSGGPRQNRGQRTRRGRTDPLS